MDYQEMLNIDEEALDLEWLDQPKRFMEISEKCADAIFEFDEAKQALELTMAELDGDIRTAPEKFDLAKVTETTVSNAVKMTDQYKEALSELNDAKQNMNILQGAVKAFDQRKRALEYLVILHGQQYFAGPSVPRNISDERQQQKERSERVNEKVKKKMTRKKK